MCSGAILLFKIPRVVIGENTNFVGGEDVLRDKGVEVVVLKDQACQEMMRDFIREHPEVGLLFFTCCMFDQLISQEWNEDIGGP